MERDLLATAVAALEKKIDEHRQNLDREKRQGFDLARAISQAEFRLEQLAKEREQAEVSEAAPVVLESYSTPIGRVVEKNEVHFILWGGNIAYIPKDMLEKEFVDDAKRKIYKLSPSSPEMTETIGPIEGFKIRYTLELQINGGRPEIMYLWELKPATNVMGESADVALSRRLGLSRRIGQTPPGNAHRHHSHLRRQFRRLPQDSQGIVSPRLLRRRPAAIAGNVHRLLAGGKQVNGAVEVGIGFRVQDLSIEMLPFINRSPYPEP